MLTVAGSGKVNFFGCSHFSPIMKKLLITTLALVAAWSAQAAVETYKIDPAHSSVGFSVRHILAKVPGEFSKFEGTVSVDRSDLEKTSAEATIEVGSINTRNEKRDTHLKTPDFFDAQKYPSITFKSKSWKKTGENTFDVTGDLTIKGTTKEVVLKTTLLGFSPGMKPGTTVSGWEGTTTIHRKDFGISLNAMLEKVVGEDIAVTISVEAVADTGTAK